MVSSRNCEPLPSESDWCAGSVLAQGLATTESVPTLTTSQFRKVPAKVVLPSCLKQARLPLKSMQ